MSTVTLDEISEAMALLHGPAMEIHQPERVATGDTELSIVESPAFIKLNTGFRKNLKALKGSKLAVFLCIALHINQNSESWPAAETIAEETGYSKQEVLRSVKELETIGLVGVTRHHRRANVYSILAFATMGQKSLGNKRLPKEKLPKEVTQNTPQKLPQEESIKKNKDTDEETSRPNSDTPTPYTLGVILATICNMNFEANKGRLLAEAKTLLKCTPPATAELLQKHYSTGSAFWRQDWRGKKGQAPSPAAIRETWGRWASQKPMAARPIDPKDPNFRRRPAPTILP